MDPQPINTAPQSPTLAAPQEPDPKANPYVGPRPFLTGEQKRFFGRDREAALLIPLVIAERMVLFYAQSGAGKSSLLNARIIPGLRERNFITLSGRVSGSERSMDEVSNLFIYNLLVSLSPADVDTARLRGMTLAEYLADLDVDAAPSAPGNGTAQSHLDAPEIIDGIRPLALIIDQFEEIFTNHPEAWAQREPFFHQLRDALDADPYLWVIFSIREDYVAQLDPYAHLLPGGLRARFYMQRMKSEAAKEAVVRPVETLRPFQAAAADELVHTLSMIAMGRDAAGALQLQPGEFVEPVQLQVVCYQLWNELQERPGSAITVDDLHSLARGKKLTEFIGDALGDFYEQAVAQVSAQFPEVSERRIRAWFTTELITEAETRGAVVQGKTRTGSPPNDLPNEVVRAFQGQFLVRGEVRGENTWFELSHDRFVVPILQRNREWQERNSLPVETAARMWNGDSARLYDGRQLEAALQLKDRHPEELSDEAIRFIEASQEESRRRRQRRQTALVGVLTLLLVLALGMAAAAARFAVLSNQNAAAAQSNAERADQQRITAEAASTRAFDEAAAARTARAEEAVQRERVEAASTQAALNLSTAVVANTQSAYSLSTAQVANAQANLNLVTAEAAKALAQAANIQSQASRFASLSDSFRFNDARLSLLMAVEGVAFADRWDARKALLNSLQRGLNTQVRQEGAAYFTGRPPNIVTYSPDGKLLAAGLADGRVELWSTSRAAPAPRVPEEFNAPAAIYALAFRSDGAVLARGGNTRAVRLWNLQTGQVVTLNPFSEGLQYVPVRGLAFQPEGSLLSVASERDDRAGRIFLYDTRALSRDPQLLDCGQGSCLAMAWSPDGRRLAVGSSTGDLRVFDLDQNGRAFESWRRDRAHGDKIWGLVWYPDGQRVATGSVDQRLAQWDTRSDQVDPVVVSPRAETPGIYSLAISPSGRFLVAGGSLPNVTNPEDFVTVWDADTLARKRFDALAGGHRQVVLGVAFDSQGDRFATAGLDNYVRQWKFDPVDPLGRTVWNIPQEGRIDGLTAAESGALFAAETRGQAVAVWQEASREPRVFNLNHTALSLSTVRGRPVLVLGGADGQVSIIDPATGQPGGGVSTLLFPAVPSAKLVAVAVSADGRLAAAAGCPGQSGLCNTLALVDVSSAPPSAEVFPASSFGKGVITALAFHPDQPRLAVGTSDGLIFVVAREERTNEWTISQAVTEGYGLSSVTLSVTSVAFSPGELSLLAAGFFDRRVALWESRSLDPIGVFDERMAGKVTALTFRRIENGAWRLVSASAQGEVREWEVASDDWIRRACQMAGSGLTEQEQARFFSPAAPAANPCGR
jgi:WD40 repeat protein